MRTAYCPDTHVELSNVTVGTPYGHVPGHQYHDVHVVISRSDSGTYRCHIVESWGSSQGDDEEHGRNEVVGRGGSIEDAAGKADQAAKEAGIKEYLAQALTQAADVAEEALDAIDIQ